MNVLVLEDDDRLREELVEYLRVQGYGVVEAGRPSDAHRLVREAPVEVALVDVRLPEYDGLRFIAELRESAPRTEAIVMSGHGDMDSVVEALRLGAFDYLRKPFTPMDIQAAIVRTNRYLESERDRERLERVCADLRTELSDQFGSQYVGSSEKTRNLLDLVARAARTSVSPVLITGESGTGKELIARLIHAASDRADKPFVPVNCAAVSRDLFESEFFGHDRGAYTDAKEERRGYFRSAHGGTLFLDELTEIPASHQSKLLRVVENGVVHPVGSDRENTVDVRIVSATNRGIESLRSGESLRVDLFYRLAVIEIAVHPLREKPEDIPELVAHFCVTLSKRMGGANRTVPDDWIRRLLEYSFPGNVRELRNLVERALILGSENVGVPEPLDPRERSAVAAGSDRAARPDPRLDLGPTPGVSGHARDWSPGTTLAELEQNAVRRALAVAEGNRTAAARMLGITRQSFDRRLVKYDAR